MLVVSKAHVKLARWPVRAICFWSTTFSRFHCGILAGMEVTAKEKREWINRPLGEMCLGLAEWIEKQRGMGEGAKVSVVIPDVPLKLNKADGGRTRHVGGQMNGLEKRYAAHLELRRATGEIQSYLFEPIKLRLAQSTFFTIDFLLWMADGSIELHEAKGHWEDDSRVKIKVAAKMFPWWRFVGVMRDKKTKDWKFEEFKA